MLSTLLVLFFSIFSPAFFPYFFYFFFLLLLTQVSDDKTKLEVERETDNGTQVININMPSVVTTDLRLNEPRYATLPNIMKAKKKKIEALDAAGLGVDLEPRYTVVEVNEPPKRDAGVLVEDVDELVDKLKNEAGVL